VPLALPGVVAGLIFTFIPVLGDTISPTLLGGSQEYLGVSISSLVRSLKFTTAAAFATLILALAFVMLLLAGAVARAFRAERAGA
jgi:ABC-type spermidine/putrescine transport system permease subunit I